MKYYMTMDITIHRVDINRDVDETLEWIKEKDAILSTDDLGKDLPSVQALQRKHEGMEKDLEVLEVCFLSTIFLMKNPHHT